MILSVNALTQHLNASKKFNQVLIRFTNNFTKKITTLSYDAEIEENPV